MSLKIQINTLDALERLLGGDTEIEMDIRQNIAEAFATKHLKALANTAALQAISVGIQTEIKHRFVSEVKTGYSSKIVLKDDIREQLLEVIKSTVNNEVHELIKAEIDAQGIRDKITKLVEYQAKRIETELSDLTLSRRIDMLVEKRLKEKLGLS